MRAPVRILGLARHLMVGTFLPEAALRGRDGSGGDGSGDEGNGDEGNGGEGRLMFASTFPSIPFSSVHLRKPAQEGHPPRRT